MSKTLEVLNNCTVEGMVIKLPNIQLDKKEYIEVKKALEKIGGKWKGGKIAGFEFNEDPTQLLEEISSGVKRNIKKEFQFFATPDHLADRLIELANLKEDHSVLEPSAGDGAIIKAIYRKYSNIPVDWCEIMDTNKKTVFDLTSTYPISTDFLELPLDKQYDRIIANPPFSKNQDITHVLKMYKHLKPGGRLVSIMSTHWKTSTNRVETSFKDWLYKNGGFFHDIHIGEFKSSGTNVATSIVVIDKPF